MFKGWQESAKLRNTIRWGLIIGSLAAIVLFFELAWLITDWFWFQEVGYEGVFWTTLFAKWTVGGIAGALFLVLFGGNLYMAERIGKKNSYVHLMGMQIPPLRSFGEKTFVPLIVGVSVVLAVFMGMSASAQWQEFLLFLKGLPFDLQDPLYQKDIGFYVFKLPFIVSIYQWLSFITILVIIGVGLLYFVRGAFLFIPPKTWNVSAPVRRHILLLLSFVFFVGVLGAWIDVYQLLFTKRGVVFGPGYTDVTTQIWVLRLMIVMNLLAGLSLLAYLYRNNWKVPAATILALFAVSIVGKGIYPNFVQKFKVLPNEIVLEKPFLEHNIQYTRLAYRLDDIEDREFPVGANLTREDLKKNDLTVKNIRLWDHAPLLQTYSQLQEIRTYYKFIDVDNDRYMINNEYRQVMLSPRELSYGALPSRTWVNEHLTYTHGYGVVLGPVNRVNREGLPEFFIKDIPPVATTPVDWPMSARARSNHRPGIMRGASTQNANTDQHSPVSDRTAKASQCPPITRRDTVARAAAIRKSRAAPVIRWRSPRWTRWSRPRRDRTSCTPTPPIMARGNRGTRGMSGVSVHAPQVRASSSTSPSLRSHPAATASASRASWIVRMSAPPSGGASPSGSEFAAAAGSGMSASPAVSGSRNATGTQPVRAAMLM